MSELTIDKTPGRPTILVVDVTRDSRGFEHCMTRSICDELRKRGIELTGNSPVFAADKDEYLKAFTPNFNCLLLVAHGGKDPNDGTVSEIDGPLGRMDWYWLSELSENLRDKFVMLAVCYGYCKDAISALMHEDSWALSLLASEEPLKSKEAIAFFPSFLEALVVLCSEDIDPVQIQHALETNNALSGNKMKLFSQGLPS